MSNALAIALVSAVLEARITALLEANGISGMTVSTTHPEADPDPGVYLKLYQITPNATLRNLDLPTRREDGTVVRRPRLAIDLHYLITFIGDPSRYEAERFAAIVMTDLHARPTLTPDAIADVLGSLPPDHPLVDSDLGDQLERVRFTPRALDLENLARLWTMLNQSYYGLSVAYDASVVLLDADIRPREALPVTSRGLTVVPATRPRILRAHADDGDQPIVAIGESLVLRGSSLSGESTWLRIAGRMFEVPPPLARPERIEIDLAPALSLRAGVVAVQVVHRIDVGGGGAPELRDGPESNAVAIAIVPSVTPAAPAVVALGGGRFDVRLTVTPVPDPEQELALQLDALVGDGAASSTTWRLDGVVTVFTVDAPPSGATLVRVRVDGAQSRTTQSGTGEFDGPSVTFP